MEKRDSGRVVTWRKANVSSGMVARTKPEAAVARAATRIFWMMLR